MRRKIHCRNCGGGEVVLEGAYESRQSVRNVLSPLFRRDRRKIARRLFSYLLLPKDERFGFREKFRPRGRSVLKLPRGVEN